MSEQLELDGGVTWLMGGSDKKGWLLWKEESSNPALGIRDLGQP